jgi:hypothetical protein
MNSRGFKISALIAGIAISFALVFLIRNGTRQPVAVVNTVTPVPTAPVESAEVTKPSEPRSVIEDVLDRLQKRTITPSELLAFRQALLEGDPAAAIAQIRAFLATGKDVSTGFAFSLGQGGVLERAPTLRLLLLDVLGQLSRKARTADAADVSKEILSEKKSADEWAIAVRNVAWHDPQSGAFLASKFSEMFHYDSWRREPSSGFLEAFDAAVFSRQVSVMATLNDALQDPMVDLQRAAAVALDRLAESAPLEVMLKLNAQPEMFAEHPFLRADWFAKADLRESAQRAAFEAYLARPDVTMAEKTKALKALAAPGHFVSDSLITVSPPPVDDASRDAAVLSAATDWSRQFPNLATPLAILRERLAP